jgi:hypothetical protein
VDDHERQDAAKRCLQQKASVVVTINAAKKWATVFISKDRNVERRRYQKRRNQEPKLSSMALPNRTDEVHQTQS